MKVVIADDEPYARSGLKSMLEESGLPVYVIGEAKNGEELVALVSKYLPDLAFVDIRMPLLDGLSAIERGKALSPATQWIILTSYSEFAYAHQAVKLGASDYLLKPVGPADLRAALDRRLEIKARDLVTRTSEFEGHLTSLLNRTGVSFPAARQDTPSAPWPDTVLIGLEITLDAPFEDEAREEAKTALCGEVRGAIRDSVGDDFLAAIVPLANGRLFTVMSWNRAAYTAGLQVSRRFRNRLTQLAQRSEVEGLSVTLIVGEECRTYEQLERECERSGRLLSFRAVAGIGGEIAIAKLEVYRDNGAKRVTVPVERLVGAFRGSARMATFASLDEVELLLRPDRGATRAEWLPSIVRFLERNVQVDGILGERTGSLGGWISAARASLEAATKPSADGRSGDLIAQMKGLVEERYFDDLRMADIAKMLRFTPNYLSSVFHRKVGMTFIQYLTKCRLEGAKQLLLNRGLRIEDVARRVGYRSSRNFTRAFRELFDCYPSEFRKTLWTGRADSGS